MLTEIIIKEIHEQLTTLKMAFSTVIIILVMVTNAVVFNYTYDKKQAAYDREILENQNKLQEQSDKLIHLLFHWQRLTKPPARLEFISESKDNVLPNGIAMNYFEESQPQFHQKEQNNYLSLVNALDWSYILIYLISFICLAFSYNAFSGEKEKGTLKLMLSN
jgi:ABC-type transport system involved in multi-copper enzyme maturation permease subunit